MKRDRVVRSGPAWAAFLLVPALLGMRVSFAEERLAPQPSAAAQQGPDDPVFRALRTELDRARTSLKIEDNPPPYFISASVNDIELAGVQAVFGAITGSDENRVRTLDVKVRVGDRTLDSSRFARRSPRWGDEGALMPEEDNERELRRATWLAVDQGYKDAVENLARKKAVLAGQVRSAEDKLPDFTEETPVTTVVPPPAAAFDRAGWEKKARRLSSIFREFPDIYSASLRVSWLDRVVRYLDTDGFVALHPRTLWSLEVSAETQAADGMPLRDFVSFYAKRPEEAPGEEEMAAALREMAHRLTARRAASSLEEPVSGPILLEDEAAAEFFMALVGRSAAVGRDPVSEDPRFSGGQGGGSSWKGRLGSRVAAPFLNVRDDPTLATGPGGVGLIGSYPVDDEGIPSQPVILVQKGILKGVLSTRTPIKGSSTSNGHARSPFFFGYSPAMVGARSAPSVLVVSGDDASLLAPAEVKARFIETIRERELEAGYIIRRIQNEAANPPAGEDAFVFFSGGRGQRPGPVADPIDVVRVAPDGTETPLRGVKWGEHSVRILKDLLLVSGGAGGEAAFNMLTSGSGGGGGYGFDGGGMGLASSVVCPRAVLIDEADLAPMTGPFLSLPAMQHPYFAGKAPVK